MPNIPSIKYYQSTKFKFHIVASENSSFFYPTSKLTMELIKYKEMYNRLSPKISFSTITDSFLLYMESWGMMSKVSRRTL
jgi:hypothetical protein